MLSFGQARLRGQQLELRGELTPVDGIAPPALIWRGNSTHLPAEVVVVAAREIACSGDKAAGWQAIMSLRTGETLSGCCSVRRGYDASKAPLAAAGKSRRRQKAALSVAPCTRSMRLSSHSTESGPA